MGTHVTAHADTRLSEFVTDAILLDIERRCLGAVIAGGDTWQQFMEEAERRLGKPWAAIKNVLDERYANRKLAA